MERLLYNRGIILAGCVLLLGVIYFVVSSAFWSAASPGDAANSAAIEAEARRKQADDALAAWQDESHLVDKTGEEEAPPPGPPASAAGPPAQPAAPQPDTPGDGADKDAAAPEE